MAAEIEEHDVTVHLGDAVEVLANLPDGSVNCCVTSPPYYGLRDYGTAVRAWRAVEFVPMVGLPAVQVPAMECSLGLEPDPMAYVAHIDWTLRPSEPCECPDATNPASRLGSLYYGMPETPIHEQSCRWFIRYRLPWWGKGFTTRKEAAGV